MATTTTNAGSELRARREALGLSRLTVAAAAGCSLTSVQNVEGGYVTEVATRIEAALQRLESVHNEIDPGAASTRVDRKESRGLNTEHLEQRVAA